MINQMNHCGVTQSYLDVRGLKHSVANVETKTLTFHFKKDLIISFTYNAGRDVYECTAYAKNEQFYKNLDVHCEDFKKAVEAVVFTLYA